MSRKAKHSLVNAHASIGNRARRPPIDRDERSGPPSVEPLPDTEQCVVIEAEAHDAASIVAFLREAGYRASFLATTSRLDRKDPAPEGRMMLPPRADEPPSQAVQMHADEWTIEVDRHRLRLTAVQFGIVARLMVTPGQWVRTAVLQREVLGANARTGASNVRFHIHRLRRSLGCCACYLHGKPRWGYMWSPHRCDSPQCMCRAVPPGATPRPGTTLNHR